MKAGVSFELDVVLLEDGAKVFVQISSSYLEKIKKERKIRKGKRPLPATFANYQTIRFKTKTGFGSDNMWHG